MKKIKRPRKYFAPQNEGTERKCDHPGCEKAGEYRAPKDRKLKIIIGFVWSMFRNITRSGIIMPAKFPKRTKARKPVCILKASVPKYAISTATVLRMISASLANMQRITAPSTMKLCIMRKNANALKSWSLKYPKSVWRA